MSIIQQFENLAGNSPVNRRRALLGISVLALAACSRTNQQPTATADSNIAYYTCPMHTFVQSQDPKGKCPVCGMDLVPVMKSTAAAETKSPAPAVAAAAPPIAPVDTTGGTVNIAPERLQEIGATTEVVARRDLTRQLRAPARAEIDESALRDINVKAGAGYIEKLYANYEGMSVRKGQPLMRVLCEGWLQTQIDYIKSYRAWKRTPLMSPNNSIALDNQLELMRARIRVWDLSEDQIHDLEKFAISTNEIDLRTGHGLSGSFNVVAPFDGYVRTKKAIEGMRFEPGQSLLELADHSHIWIVAEFPESQAPYVNVGQKMTVTFPSMPGEKIDGEINFLDPHVDEDQRRIRARIVIEDRKREFHPGLFAEVTGETPLGRRLSISTGAVVPTGDKYIVFVDHGGGKLEPREVELGVHSGDYDEVLSGLNEGERVISSANFLIDAESRIQGVLKTWGTRQ
ncbi:MAG: efflux RND transporter periplasmic adaptor subunit [Methylacidiphilales bacterium]|nr:efflux RND transporter periplasmic adaptor subunit [Candidatus Methylacidiphilales bacterium]